MEILNADILITEIMQNCHSGRSEESQGYDLE